MLKKVGTFALMLASTIAFLQPGTAYAQMPYGRANSVYNQRGDYDRYDQHRYFEERKHEERRAAERARDWQKRRWHEQQYWERQNYRYNHLPSRYPY